MLYPLSILSLVLLALIHLTHGQAQFSPSTGNQNILNGSPHAAQPAAIPLSTREYWMRQANLALTTLTTPCPFAAFGTVIVNHTDTHNNPLGELVCMGANNRTSGNPTLHGEIAAITNCTSILTSPAGPYKLSGSEALAAFADLSLYTNAEACPMCASAIRWAGFREYVFGTDIESLVRMGWSQIDISSREVFEESKGLGAETLLVGGVLTEETDRFFQWQFDDEKACPHGCAREGLGGSCIMD